ncbi:glucose-6-phosphate 1-dehydrogenase [Amylibacter marinus]|uniref:Glucose-6-phosphate 1-dehydrogenase n=1 Tax=Amylibacter marinus TaxID=1475483 RepID=A0ABQ5VSZ5_9RHOB|nr:glucose-6-phosphate dehydrogenase [Amylibacter marinus]GLQ34296.1 glucose-6-phosphate 1-dehydrogenase [Amylibacter marinus]
MVSSIIPVQPFDLVVFGGTGDLSRRKILPALFRRVMAGQCPEGSRIIGASRSKLTADEFREMVRKSINEFVPAKEFKAADLEAFLLMVEYCAVDAFSDAGWTKLADTLSMGDNAIRTFYLSISPTLITPTTRQMASFKLITHETRVVVEKPLGTDLDSAKSLNKTLKDVFEERQIYRIDHYLGKETVQNLMALRFANVLLEPLWNSKYVDHVQITVAETVSVDGRGEYYDLSGAMRDMVQNHLMQLLCLVAMEPPSRFDADAVRDEKLKVIRALEPVSMRNTVRGQYRSEGEIASFLDHVGNSASNTESYVALKAEIGNWRWAGVPFYLRTGKALKKRVSEITLVFKPVPHSIFDDSNEGFQNKLIIRLQPEEGITLHMSVKEPGPGGMRLTEVPLDMSFADVVPEGVTIDAYERLIMDAVRGNQTLFMRGDEVEAAWAWVDHIIAQWDASSSKPHSYDQGSTGPEDAIALLARDARRWQPMGET